MCSSEWGHHLKEYQDPLQLHRTGLGSGTGAGAGISRPGLQFGLDINDLKISLNTSGCQFSHL